MDMDKARAVINDPTMNPEEWFEEAFIKYISENAGLIAVNYPKSRDAILKLCDNEDIKEMIDKISKLTIDKFDLINKIENRLRLEPKIESVIIDKIIEYTNKNLSAGEEPILLKMACSQKATVNSYPYTIPKFLYSYTNKNLIINALKNWEININSNDMNRVVDYLMPDTDVKDWCLNTNFMTSLIASSSTSGSSYTSIRNGFLTSYESIINNSNDKEFLIQLKKTLLNLDVTNMTSSKKKIIGVERICHCGFMSPTTSGLGVHKRKCKNSGENLIQLINSKINALYMA